MKAKQTTLKNGLRIVTVPMPGNPTVTVMVMVAAGTRYETRATNGLSHFLEHMCFKGTKKRGTRRIAYELESMGAETNAFTSSDYTGYYAKGQAHLFPKILDVVADVYLNSTFPEAEIEKERGVICGEIDMYEDLPQRRVQEYFDESLYGDQPAGYATLGPKENIRKFSRADFLKYRHDHYIAPKTTIVVVGNVEAKKVDACVKEQFAGVRTGKKIAKKKVLSKTGEKIFTHVKKTDQSHLALGLRAMRLGHPDHMAFAVAAAILGSGMSSRLFFRLREEMGAGYYVRANNSAVDDIGDFEVLTGTEPKRVIEVIGAIREEIEKLRTEKVAEQELKKTQEYLIGTMYMGLESTDAVASHVATLAVLNQPLKLPKDLEKEIRKVTARDVLRVAKKYLKPEQFHLAVIGPEMDKKVLEKALKVG